MRSDFDSVAIPRPRSYCHKCHSPYIIDSNHENSNTCRAAARYYAMQAAGYVNCEDTSTASIARSWLYDYGYRWAVKHENTYSTSAGLLKQSWVPAFIEKLVVTLRWNDPTWFQKRPGEQSEIIRAALAGAFEGYVEPEIKMP